MKKRVLSVLAIIFCIAIGFSLTACADKNEPEANDADIGYHTVSFDSKGGEAIAEQKVKHGETAIVPIPPQKQEYIFDGWYLNGERWSFFDYPVTGDITLTANWVHRGDALEYATSGDGYVVAGIGDYIGGDIIIPATYKGRPVIGIAPSAFNDCGSITTSVVIPDSVMSIGDSAFSGCRSLVNITIPNSVTSIGDSAFSGCSGLTSIIIPNSVTSIVSSAFQGCTGIIQKENGVSYVDKWAIVCDIATTTVSLREDTKGIAARAFYNCSSLISVTIGENVTNICESAFYGCSSLASITFADTRGWYEKIMSTESEIDVTNAAVNATYFKSNSYLDYYTYFKR